MKKDKFNYKKAYKKLSKRIAFLENNDNDFLTQNFSIEELEKKAKKEYFSGLGAIEKNSIIIDNPTDKKISSGKVNEMFEKNKREPYAKLSKKENYLIPLFVTSTNESIKKSALNHVEIKDMMPLFLTITY